MPHPKIHPTLHSIFGLVLPHVGMNEKRREGAWLKLKISGQGSRSQHWKIEDVEIAIYKEFGNQVTFTKWKYPVYT